MTAVQIDMGLGNGAGSAQIEALVPVKLPVTCDPQSIECGMSCGMSDMCGESPCLCGAADQWGDCACNGTQTTCPELELATGDSSSVQVFKVGDDWYLFGLGGSTDVTATAALKHYDTGTQTLHVQVGGVGGAFFLALALLVCIVAALVFGVRAGARRHRREHAGAEPADGGYRNSGSGDAE